jgi:hypothetical protein
LVSQFYHFSTIFYNCFGSGIKRKGKPVNSTRPKAAHTAQQHRKRAPAPALWQLCTGVPGVLAI